MASLARWLLRTFADNWPSGLPSDLRLADRDDSVILGVDTTADPTTLSRDYWTADWDLTRGNVLGVATAEWDQVPAGLGGSEYRAEPVLSVRIEGAHEREGGKVAHAADFETLAQNAEDVVRNVDNGDLQAAPLADWHVAEPETPRPNMSAHAKYFEWNFDVAPEGYRTL